VFAALYSEKINFCQLIHLHTLFVLKVWIHLLNILSINYVFNSAHILYKLN